MTSTAPGSTPHSSADKTEHYPPFAPLKDLVVVSVEQAVAAPLASRHLADLGARVIKVERPGGGDLARSYDRTVHGSASFFVWLNRGKESIELDLTDPPDTEVLERLVERADVLIQNLAPGALERMGFGTSVLRGRRPELITCDISGYGDGGPYTGNKAYDLLIQCETGLVSITGSPETPSRVGISVADIAAGMYAYSGILAALYDRAATGVGAEIEISMLESLGEWMGFPYYYTVYGGSQPPRSGASHATITPYGPYLCADGVTLNIGLQNEREWQSFCRTFLRMPDLSVDQRFSSNADRAAHRTELDAIVQGVFRGLGSENASARLADAQIAWATQRDVAGFASHPQLVARDRFRQIGIPGGRVNALRPPINVHGRSQVMGDVPALNEHGAAIRQWLQSQAEPNTAAEGSHG